MMKCCKGCVYEEDMRTMENGGTVNWGSSEPHPCMDCERLPRDTNYQDNYLPLKEEYCECEEPNKEEVFNGIHCVRGCNKPLKPTPKLPERLDIKEEIAKIDGAHYSVIVLQETINKLIDYLKGLEERNEDLLEEIKNFERGEP